MKTLKKFLIILFVMIIIVLILFVIQKYRKRDINYQLTRLQNGTTEQKIAAIEFIAEKNAYNEIPKIMAYIDSEESFLYYGKIPYTMTCTVTLALEKMTNKEYGNTCDSSHSKTDDKILEIKIKWKEWYENEYKK